MFACVYTYIHNYTYMVILVYVPIINGNILRYPSSQPLRDSPRMLGSSRLGKISLQDSLLRPGNCF